MNRWRTLSLLALLWPLAGAVLAQSYTFSTLAGTASTTGKTDGTGTAALFFDPIGVAVDPGGNVYVADQWNHAIRKITAAGVVTTFAGSAGAAGSADGQSTAARFNYPGGIAVDASGTLYVADTNNGIIRKISPSGAVSTLAGTAGVSGSADGTGGAAQFNSPYGVAVDGAGTVYVADAGNHAIRKISPGGAVTTLAGKAGNFGAADGVGGAAQFYWPAGVAVDGSGSVYVADQGNNAVRKVTAGGIVTTLAGTAGTFGGADGAGGAARFDIPCGIAIDSSGNLFVADSINETIRKIAPGGWVTTVAGAAVADGSADGAGVLVRFDLPSAVAVDASGNLYVADLYNDTIRKGVLTQGPGIAFQPQSQSVTAGSTVVFSAAASGGTGLSYKWYLNGNVLSGATNSTLVTIASLVNAGNYTCIAASSLGTTSSSAAALAVTTTSNPGRLVNLSVLSIAGTGDQVLTIGFVTGGVGTSGSQNLLIRATGPALAAFGQGNVLADPNLTVLSGSTSVASNDNWGSSAGNQSAVSAADAATGAFPLTDPNSLDAACVANLPANGGYTVTVVGKGGGAGNALAEVYDDTPPGAYAANFPRLINLSCTQQVAAGGVLTAGFTVGGTTSKSVLIRATGPALSGLGVSGVMPDPALTVFSGQTAIAANSGWGGSPGITAADSAVYAFPLTTPSSKDSAVVMTLAPGSYTVQVRSASGASGVALIEVYDYP